MSNQTLQLTEQLYSYLLDHSLREHKAMRELREVTATLPESMMQIAPEQAQFMQLLVRLMGAKRVLEVGTFTGYSALSMALALPDSGELIACDINADWMSIGLPFWQQGGVEKKINFKKGPASITLETLLQEGEVGCFDMAFIDADKENYQTYFEYCLQLVRKGGLILIDNTLWDGAVCDPDNQSDSTLAIRAFNNNILNDDRVFLSQLPIADGLTLALVK
jgi:caffeoyl-CoA O-methyltransferase